MIEAGIRREITALEDRRLIALRSGDVVALGALMADDLVHIHGNGKIDDKAAYLSAIAEKYSFLRIERGELIMRRYGDVVIVHGPVEQTVSIVGTEKPKHIKAVATQTWVRDGESWKQSTCHMGFVSVE